MISMRTARKRSPAADQQRLKIGLFTDSFPPIINGVSVTLSNLHAELLAQGQDAHVFTFGNQETDQPNVWVTRGVPLGNSPFQGALMLDRPSTLIAEKLSVFHVNDPFNIAYIALRMAQRANRPLVFTNHTRHDIYLEEKWSSVLRPMLRLYVEAQMTYVMRMSDVITAPAYSSLRWMQQLAPDVADRMRVVHNGVQLQPYERIPENAVRRDQFGIGSQATIFGYVGRVAPEKNLEVFAHAFLVAVGQGADAHWVVIGDGSSRVDLEAITAPVRERVHFLGKLPNQEMPRYLPMFDVFATPSVSEVNPISVIEAIACSKPFLGVRADWWDEYPNHQQAGILAENNPADLAAAISWFCQQEGARRAMGVHAHQISCHFDVRQVAAQWIEIYRTLGEQYALIQAS